MTKAKELGIEGLRSLIGKKVVMRYPPFYWGEIWGTRIKGRILDVCGDYSDQPGGNMTLAKIEGREGLTWVWKTTDISEVRPNPIEQFLQGIRGK